MISVEWRRTHPGLVMFLLMALLAITTYAIVLTWMRWGAVAGIATGLVAIGLLVAAQAWARPAFFDDDGTMRTTR